MSLAMGRKGYTDTRLLHKNVNEVLDEKRISPMLGSLMSYLARHQINTGKKIVHNGFKANSKFHQKYALEAPHLPRLTCSGCKLPYL